MSEDVRKLSQQLMHKGLESLTQGEKLDSLRQEQLAQLLVLQQDQLDMIKKLIEDAR